MKKSELLKRVTRDNYQSVVYISHGYGGKKKNLDEIEEVMKIANKVFPDYLFINPVGCFSSLYSEVDYNKGLDMTLCLLDELCDEMWVCDENYQKSRGCLIEIYYCDKFNIPYKFMPIHHLKELLLQKEKTQIKSEDDIKQTVGECCD